jgi:hypothetical protein
MDSAYWLLVTGGWWLVVAGRLCEGCEAVQGGEAAPTPAGACLR